MGGVLADVDAKRGDGGGLGFGSRGCLTPVFPSEGDRERIFALRAVGAAKDNAGRICSNPGIKFLPKLR